MPYETGLINRRRERSRSEKRKTLLFCFLFAAALVFSGYEWPAKRGHALLGIASAQEDWRQEFEVVCSQTQDAMALSAEELSGLIERCDKLKSRIEKLDESARKVYLKRLQLCRDLYVFVIESKRGK
jgi:hypothetical protein